MTSFVRSTREDAQVEAQEIVRLRARADWLLWVDSQRDESVRQGAVRATRNHATAVRRPEESSPR